MDQTRAIEQLGLNKNESQIYLLLLRSGSQYGSQIQTALELDKVPVYRALKVLKSRDLVRAIGETRNQQFAAQPLETLLGEYDQRLEQLTLARLDIETLARSIHDEQQGIYKERKIRVFEGVAGYRLWNEERLQGTDCIREFGRQTFLQTFFSPDEIDDYMRAYIDRRVAKRIRIKCLGASDEVVRTYDKSSKKHLKDSRVVDTADDLQAFFSLNPPRKMRCLDRAPRKGNSRHSDRCLGIVSGFGDHDPRRSDQDGSLLGVSSAADV